MYQLLLLALLALPAYADIVARGDFQTRDASQWHLQQGRDISRQFRIVESPVRPGKRYAAEFTVRDGDQHGSTSGERSEVSNLLPKDFPTEGRDKPGDDYYYAWSTLIPDDFSEVVNWAVLTQWHEAQSGVGSVNLALRINRDQKLILTHNTRADSNSVRVYELFKTLPKGKWNDFVVRVKWSCGNDGVLQLWHKFADEPDYAQLVDFQGQTAKNTGYCNPIYKKHGLYRSAANTATHTVYHTGFVQATTFDEAAIDAHGIPDAAPPANPKQPPTPIKGVTRNGWGAWASSEESQAEPGRAGNAVDGDLSTSWVSRYSSSEPRHPHTLTVDMHDTYRVDAVHYYTDGSGYGGEIRAYTLFLSLDGERWEKAAEGEFKNTQENTVTITPTDARYLRLVSRSSYPGSYQWSQGAVAAEVNIEGSLAQPSAEIIYIEPGQTCVIRTP